MSNEENKQPDPNESGLTNDVIDAALARATESVQEDTVKREPAAPSENYHNPQVSIKNTPLIPMESKDQFVGRLPVHAFRRKDSELEGRLTSFKNIDPTLGDEGRVWMDAVRGSQRHRVAKKLYEAALQSENSAWMQYVEHGVHRIYSRAIQPKIGDRKLSGIKAVNHFRHVMKMAEDREVALLASGFYLNLRAAPDSELSNMETQVLSEREVIGRLTGAAGLSGTAVYLVDHMVNLILASMVECNVDLASSDQLLDLILVTDLQHLALGQATTIFVKDYPIEVPCTTDYEKCQHVETYGLSLKYMAIHDNNKLTDYQKIHMSNPDVQLTIKDVEDYQAKGPVTTSETIYLNGDKVAINFKTPTLRQYLEDARAWVAGIQATVNTITDEETTAERRRRLVEDQARLTTLRQYSHFIKSIVIRGEGGESLIEDRDSLMLILNDLSAEDEAVEKVVAGVRRHIEAATVTIAGVPKTPCPSCEKDRQLTDEEKLHPEYIPVDAITLFFTLTSLKLQKRQETRLQDI